MAVFDSVLNACMQIPDKNKDNSAKNALLLIDKAKSDKLKP